MLFSVEFIVYRLRTGRFYQCLLIAHADGSLQIAKIFVVPEDVDLFQVHLDNLIEANHQIIEEDDSGLLIGSKVQLIDRAVVAHRTFIEHTLDEAIQQINGQDTSDFHLDGRELSHLEKRWIAHQLICAVRTLHYSGLAHGSICPANIFIDSSLNVYLADLSPYKPFYLGSDDPTLALYFYEDDSYVAPERFLSPSKELESEVQRMQKADVFSLAHIIKSLLETSREVNHLIAYRDLDNFPPLFSASVTNILMPFLHNFKLLEEDNNRLEDILFLANSDNEFSFIFARFLLGRLEQESSETLIFKSLEILNSLVEKDRALYQYFIGMLCEKVNSTALNIIRDEILVKSRGNQRDAIAPIISTEG